VAQALLPAASALLPTFLGFCPALLDPVPAGAPSAEMSLGATDRSVCATSVAVKLFLRGSLD